MSLHDEILFSAEKPVGLIGAAVVTFLIGNFVSKNGNERRQPFTRKTAKVAKTEKILFRKQQKQKAQARPLLDK